MAGTPIEPDLRHFFVGSTCRIFYESEDIFCITQFKVDSLDVMKGPI